MVMMVTSAQRNTVVCIAKQFWMFTYCNSVVNSGSDFHALRAINDSLTNWITCEKPLSELSPTRCLIQQPTFIRLTSL
jgi:hypothetical protein